MEDTVGVLSNTVVLQPQTSEIKKFDYDATRKKYLSFLNEFSTEIGLEDPWLDETRNKIKFKLTLNNGTSEQDSAISEYEVIDVEDCSALVLSNTTTEVLSMEDCYDVFVDVHINATVHGGYKQMPNTLCDNYAFHEKCLTYFLKSCNYCASKVEAVEEKCNNNIGSTNSYTSVQLDILDMKNIVGFNSYRYLSVYVYHESDFCIIRALDSLSVSNMSAQLMKIFSDFGPPSKIEVISSMVDTFSSALKHVQSVMKCDCQTESKSEPSAKSLRAFVLLKDLVLGQKQKNIIMASYYVQKALNTQEIDGTTPMIKFFGERHISEIIDNYNKNKETIVIDCEDLNDRSNVCGVCNEILLNIDNKCVNCLKNIHVVCGEWVFPKHRSKSTLSKTCQLLCAECNKKSKIIVPVIQLEN